MYSNVFIGNRGGIPIVTSTPSVSTAAVTLPLPGHIFRNLGVKGKIVIELTAALPTGTTATLPILVEVNGQTKPLLNTSAAALTAADLTSTTYLDVLFDKTNNGLIVTSVTL